MYTYTGIEDGWTIPFFVQERVDIAFFLPVCLHR